jgi:hypothetical protein
MGGSAVLNGVSTKHTSRSRMGGDMEGGVNAENESGAPACEPVESIEEARRGIEEAREELDHERAELEEARERLRHEGEKLRREHSDDR